MKLGGRRQGEERWLGEHCSPAVPERGLPGAAANTMLEDNRERLVSLTYKEPEAEWEDVARTWQMDYWLVPHRWRNSIKNA